jgi:hypothetical protein
MIISIITVCLNSENTTISTPNLILSQTYKDLENIVVNVEEKLVPKFLESFQFIWILGAETLIKSI